MQWLIDLIIEAIGVPPCFIDRGDAPNEDYDQGDLTIDGAWHDLDLSGIVPAGATAVALQIFLWNIAVNEFIEFRNNEGTPGNNISSHIVQVANVFYTTDGIVAVDPNRKIEYRVVGTNWISIQVTVKGWWL